MNYEAKKVFEKDMPKIIDYNLKMIFKYLDNLPKGEISRINIYISKHIKSQLNKNKIK